MLKNKIGTIMDDVVNTISFGVGRVNNTPVDHELFDREIIWSARRTFQELEEMAADRLGTVGSGNPYVVHLC
jgi:tRNA-splicing ligase RtcB